jgi:UDP-2-acetamido-3-amino-2,3-dideoxy-glucuronate N-acetyltransferase
MNVGLIGVGYWGTIYAKTLWKMENVNLKWICRKEHLGQSKFKNATVTSNIDDILKDKEVDCIIIATPAETHFEITKKCIEAEKPCLVEKPFTNNVKEAIDIIKLNKDNLVIMPGHIYLHHPGIQKLKELIDFEVKSVFSKRMSTSKYPNSVNEIAVHDIYIFEYLFGKQFSVKKTMGSIEHAIFNLEFETPQKTQVYIETASDYPGKIREIIFKGDKKRIIFNETEKPRITITNLETNKVTFVDFNESVSPLELQCKHFFDCVQGLDEPIVTAEDGLNNVEQIRQLLKLL